MRWTFANVFLISGFMTDWIQHVMYTLPLGINFLGFFGLDSKEEEGSEEKGEGPTTLEDMLPFGLTFHFYFYVSFFSILFCALTLRPFKTFLFSLNNAKASSSPNAGWPQATFAYILGVSLLGPKRSKGILIEQPTICLLYTSPSPRDGLLSRMPSSA